MPLSHLIYCSTRTHRLGEDLLQSIILSSSVRNRARDISGVLYCCGENLMQLLEGEFDSVEALFDRIRLDPLHRDVTLLMRKSVNKRLFPEWGMGLMEPNCKERINVDRLRCLVEDVRSNHDTAMHSVEARMLLQDFRRQLDQAA